MTTNGDLLFRIQSLERYMQKHGQDLLNFYNQGAGQHVSRVQVYVDPAEGKLRADVVLGNGVYLPFVVDVDPDWETDPPPEGIGNLVDEINGAILDAAAQRRKWES